MSDDDLARLFVSLANETAQKIYYAIQTGHLSIPNEFAIDWQSERSWKLVRLPNLHLACSVFISLNQELLCNSESFILLAHQMLLQNLIWLQEKHNEDGNLLPLTFDNYKHDVCGQLLGYLISHVVGGASVFTTEHYNEFLSLQRSLKRDDITVCAPLQHLSGNVAEMSFSNLELSRFTREDKADIYESPDIPLGYGTSGFHAISSAKYKLSGTYARTDNPAGLDKELVAVLTAFRLFRAGDVSALEVVRTSIRGNRAYSPPNELGIGISRNSYEIKTEDTSPLKLLFSAVENADTSFRIPFSRFNQSYTRTLDEDRLIDLSICLESTLLSDVRDELTFRLALRGAALLADQEDPARISTILKTLYEIRSRIVHGGSTLAELSTRMKQRFAELDTNHAMFVYEIEEVVRQILRAYVLRHRSGRTINDVNKKLDRKIINGLMKSSD